MTIQPQPIVVDLPAIASRILELAADALTPAPARRYRSVGVPAWPLGDGGVCEQLTVWVTPMVPGQPGQNTPGQYEPSPNRLRTPTFTVEVARCHPADDPVPAQLDAAAGQHLADFQALDGMVRALGFSGKVHDEQLAAAGAKGFAPGLITTVAPSGGMAAVRAQVSVTI